MSLVRMIARPMLASIFIVQGAKTLLDPDAAAARAKPMTDRMTPLIERYAPRAPTDTRTLVRINAAVNVGAGALLATSTLPRVSSLVLAGSLLPATVADHPFWQDAEREEKAAHRTQFLKNVALAGGLLLAGVDTEGRPGLRWRAKHAATDARRTARTARREARLAAREAKAGASEKARGLLRN